MTADPRLPGIIRAMRSDCSFYEARGQEMFAAPIRLHIPPLEAIAGVGSAGPVPEGMDLPASGPADLTVAQVAQRYGRHPSTVRGWCESGVLRGAYRLRGREWRVPAETLAAFEQAERGARRPGVQHSGRQTPVDLGSWRKEA